MSLHDVLKGLANISSIDDIRIGGKPLFNFHGDLTREEFLLEWFGVHGGRELGNPEQRFTNNPKNIIEFVDNCWANDEPAFMSVAPRVKHGVVYGVDRIFFDFDAKKPEQRENMELEVRAFIDRLKPIIPLIVKTFHGYHVYVFFKQGTVKIDGGVAKGFYEATQQLLINGEVYESLDSNIVGDVKRISRIPTSWHEKGTWCNVVDDKLKPTKIRGLDYYRSYGVDSEFTDRARRLAKMIKEKPQVTSTYYNPPQKGIFKIRPCFLYVLNGREMAHQHRLALVIEAFWAGKKFNEIVDLFRKRRDFKEELTKYQVEWELRKIKRERLKPYRCKTMISLNWCLKDKCGIYRRLRPLS